MCMCVCETVWVYDCVFVRQRKKDRTKGTNIETNVSNSCAALFFRGLVTLRFVALSLSCLNLSSLSFLFVFCLLRVKNVRLGVAPKLLRFLVGPL